jgi:hypothetical protein
VIRQDPIGLIDGSGHLPKEGVVVGRGGDLLFLTTDGHTIGSLGNVRLYHDWTVPGPVIVRRGGNFYSMNADRGELQPLSRDDAFDASPQFELGLDFPMARHALGLGRWAFALPGPDGAPALAQWSGECEIPRAVFVDAPGQRMLDPVSGEVIAPSAPESTALGWDDAGRALIFMREGVCGTAVPRPGVYAFSAPGVAEPVCTAKGIDAARMWGPEA